jgi:hypothetical protein
MNECVSRVREAAGGSRPSVRHEGNDGDRADEGRDGSERTQDAGALIPEAEEQERAEQPLGDAEEPAGATDAEDRIEPEDQRTVADIGNQDLGLVLEPFLIAEEQEDDHHRGAEDVIVEIRNCEPPRG